MKSFCCQQNPVWNQKFTFDVDEDHKYLNICVWCRSPEKLDKHERVVKPGKEILMGHVSIDVEICCWKFLLPFY